jgi:hypothetical protein
MSQENQKTEFVSIADLLKDAGVRQNEEPTKEVEIDGAGILDKLINQDVPEVVGTEKVAEVIPPTIEIPKQKEVKTPIQVVPKYEEKLKELIELGLIEDRLINFGEGDDAKQVLFSELEKLDKDTFNAILIQYKEADKKERDEKYISREGLTKKAEQYIEITKAGGDISKLIEEEVKYVNPILSYDLNEERDQEALVREDLRIQGIRPKVIDAQIQDFKEDMSLDLEAKKIADRTNAQFDSYIENKKKEQLEALEAEKIQQKEFRKATDDELKTLIKDENVRKLILDNTTKRGEFGLTNTDQIYFDLQQKNPKKFAQFAFFLNNPEEFLKSVGAKASLANKADVLKTMFTISPQNVKAIKKDTTEEDEGTKILNRITAQYKQ